MKLSLHLFTLVILTFLSAPSLAQTCTGTPAYNLTINYQWSAARFNNRPFFPHFSPLVVHSHSSRFSAYSRYGYATPGVRMVAETGSTGRLEAELQTAKDTHNLVRDYVVDRNVKNGVDTVFISFTVSCRHRYISAITMVAPSPDWILAIFRLNVFRNGAFVDSLNGTLRVYDAGTDSGTSFNSANVLSVPQQNIAPLSGPAFKNKYLATYSLKKWYNL